MRPCPCLLLALALPLLPVGTAAEPAAEADVVQEVLDLLHARGIMDDGEYASLTQRHQGFEESHADLPRIEWSGFMRMRFESFWFDEDALGNERSDRTRLRYSFRLEGEARIHDSVKAVFRIASGQGSSRSTNRTLGFGDDFDPDEIFLDRAYLELTPPEDAGVPGASRLRFGKMAVPFRWKHGPDSMLWDRDLAVEGVSLEWDSPEVGDWRFFSRAAYLILDENGVSRDPHVFGIQGGVSFAPAEHWELGARVTHTWWRSLDEAFLVRSATTGNLRTGLNGTRDGSGGISATELACMLRWRGIDGWPLLVYGHLVRNHDATSVAGTSDEGLGFGIGFEIGDKRERLALGAGYFRMEANAWPSRFVDAPLLGGRTNQEAIVLHALREILTDTDIKVSLFIGDPVETGGAFLASLPGADRVLLQTDLVVRF